MNVKKIIKAVLLPHVAVLIISLFAGIGALVYAFVFLREDDPLRIAAYVISFYMLLIWCLRVPRIIAFAKSFKQSNRYLSRWLGDAELRVRVTLCANMLWNGAYGAMQLGLGIYHASAWFFSLALYYFSLAVMRAMLARHVVRRPTGDNMRRELRLYRSCGWIFLIMNSALSAMIFYMIREDRLVRHHEITTIAMAAYTFTSLTAAIVSFIRYRKYNSPVLSATKGISLAASCVSMLTLEGTMLATFGDASMTHRVQRIFLALSGGAVSILVVAMAIFMIINANHRMKGLESNE